MNYVLLWTLVPSPRIRSDEQRISSTPRTDMVPNTVPRPHALHPSHATLTKTPVKPASRFTGEDLGD